MAPVDTERLRRMPSSMAGHGCPFRSPTSAAAAAASMRAIWFGPLDEPSPNR